MDYSPIDILFGVSIFTLVATIIWPLLRKLHYYYSRFHSKSYLQANIDYIKTYSTESYTENEQVIVGYKFKLNNKIYSGEASVPVNYFLHDLLPPGPIIMYESTFKLPILFAEDVKIIGEEHIEHYLLQRKSRISICYHTYNPSNNYATEYGKPAIANSSRERII